MESLCRILVFFEFISNDYKYIFKNRGKLDAFTWGISRMLVWYGDFERLNEIDVEHLIMKLCHIAIEVKKRLQTRNKVSPLATPICLSLIYLLYIKKFNSDLAKENTKSHNEISNFINEFEEYDLKIKVVSGDGGFSKLIPILQQNLNNNFTSDYIHSMIQLSSGVS